MAVLNIDGIVRRNPAILHDMEVLRVWSYELAHAIGMKPVSFSAEPYAHWPDGAPSFVLFIEESAIVGHAYPEADYIELILHSCKPIPDPDKVACTIIEKLGLDVRYYQYEERRNWRELVLAPWQPERWSRAVLEAVGR